MRPSTLQAECHQTARYRPLLERLEDRLAPAVTITLLDLDGDGNADDLRLVGDGNSSTVVIEPAGLTPDTYQISVDVKSNGNFTDPADTNAQQFSFTDGSVVLDLRLGKGNDQLTFQGGSLSAQSMLVLANLGAGNDTFTVQYFGTNVTNQSHLTLDIVGGGGADTVTALVQGTYSQSALSVRGNLGGGSDVVDFSIDAALDNGVSVDMDWELGGGNNVLDLAFFGVGTTGSAVLDINVTGGNVKKQRDVVGISFQGGVGNGTLPTSVSIDADLLAGNDAFDVLLDGGAFNLAAESQMQVSARGGVGNDSLAVRFDQFGNLDSVLIPAQSLFKVDFSGGAGRDSLTVESTSLTLISLELDGLLRVRLEGGAGNDTVTIRLDNNLDSDGDYDIVAHGGAGNDLFDFFLFAGGGVGFSPLGKVLLDGGVGVDTLDTSTAVFANAIRFE